jgi:hypothetical protein
MTAPSRTTHSIRTEYDGQMFRSKLEADYARFFDEIGLRWVYEDKGRYFGDVFYLVDFWLPRSRQIIEVKGVFQPDDCKKIQAVLAHSAPRKHCDPDSCPDIPIIAAMPDGRFHGWVRRTPPTRNWKRFVMHDCHTIELAKCLRCRGWWFYDPDGSWQCQCCGASEGNAHIADVWHAPIPAFPDLSELRRRGRIAAAESSCASPPIF